MSVLNEYRAFVAIRTARNNRAKFMREELNRIRKISILFNHNPELIKSVRDDIIRNIIRNNLPDKLPRLNTKSLRSFATLYHRHADNTINRMGERDTEYYSACGHDDYLSDLARDIRKDAEEYKKAARFAKRFN